jgi:hypothetical protein
MDRRFLLKNSLALGSLFGMGACATTPPKMAAAVPPPGPSVPVEDIPPRLAPIRAHPDRLFDMTTSIRPFRRQGPRLDVEHIGDTMVVHNYGHGGSGWSLSWGLANMRRPVGRRHGTHAGFDPAPGVGHQMNHCKS